MVLCWDFYAHSLLKVWLPEMFWKSQWADTGQPVVDVHAVAPAGF